ncbi:transglutaminase domain-containing protein [Falsiroseomonas sp. E2-1-a20]|uniref:transglutaminase domain-containing protein n=1 Tax=Falsiroseomonas sp. E2-1-a20 TaxID=3239300 RepID=UPI003F368B33
MPTVTLDLTDPVPPGAPLLLAPRFPDAFGFRLDSFEVEHGEVLDTLKATNSAQEAYLIRPTAAPIRPVLRYRMEAFAGDPPGWIWTPPATRYVVASDELRSFVAALVRGAADEAEALRRIVDHAADHFWYGHGPGSLMEERKTVPLLTGPTRGHCLDMHGYCVAACLAAGITAAYTAGFWFKAGSDYAPGMHCWFVAKVDGAIVHYDVSHQLKLPTWPVLPGLNPVPGLRFLAAAGKGLVFQVNEQLIDLAHFAKPVWVTEDGREHHPAHALLLDAKVPFAGRHLPDGLAC